MSVAVSAQLIPDLGPSLPAPLDAVFDHGRQRLPLPPERKVGERQADQQGDRDQQERSQADEVEDGRDDGEDGKPGDAVGQEGFHDGPDSGG
jgi:hypothetical protein